MQNQRLSNIYFLLGIGLISLFAYTLLFSTISFIRGYSLSAWQFPVAIVMMLITQYYASHELFKTKPKLVFFKSSTVLLILTLACLIYSYSVYDISYDGQWYHQETVYQLKNGWNPYYKELPVPKIPGVPDVKAVWCSGPHVPPKENPNGDQDVKYIKYESVNYFVKGAEIAQAAIYKLTGRIETGKAINQMMLLASFFLCLSVFYKLGRWNTKKKWGIALLFALNPVALYQLTSFCVDGLMYSLLLSLLAVFVLMIPEKNKYVNFLFGLIIMILINIKFTALVFGGIFCLAFVLYLFLKKNRVLVKRVFITGSISFIIGFVFIGFHPYMTNLIGHNNIFYTLDETGNEINGISPAVLRNKNRFEQSFISYGSYSYDPSSDESAKKILKIPFTINKRELLNANNVELMMAAFGPFFSGALIVSGVLLGLLAFRHSKESDFKTGLFSICFLLFSVFLIPASWWARFVPQFWIFPCLILFMSEIGSFRSGFIRPILYLSLVLNILWALTGFLFNIIISDHINYQIAQLKTLSQPILVEYCGYRDMRSNRNRFIENGIPFIETNVTGNHIYGVIHSNTRFETTEELPILPETFLMKLNRKLNNSQPVSTQ